MEAFLFKVEDPVDLFHHEAAEAGGVEPHSRRGREEGPHGEHHLFVRPEAGRLGRAAVGVDRGLAEGVDEGRVFDAREVEVLHGGHEPGLRLGRREKDEAPGLDVHGRRGKPQDFREPPEGFRGDAAGRVVVFAGVARAGEFEHVHEGLLKINVCRKNLYHERPSDAEEKSAVRRLGRFPGLLA